MEVNMLTGEASAADQEDALATLNEIKDFITSDKFAKFVISNLDFVPAAIMLSLLMEKIDENIAKVNEGDE